jgi:hypothetical protein
MTGGNAEAKLFVDTNTGKMLSANQTYAMVADLSAPYRLESSPTGAAFRKLGRFMERAGSKAVGVGYLAAGTAELAAVAVAAHYLSATKGSGDNNKSWVQRLSELSSRTKGQQSAVAAVATILAMRNYNVLKGSPTDNSIFKGLTNLWRSWTTLRLGSVVEELVSDGVSDKTRALMRRVGHSHKDLDIQVQHTSHVELLERVRQFSEKNSGVGSWMSSIGNTSKTRNRTLAQLFRKHVEDPQQPQAVREFRKLLLENKIPLRGHHMCTCYGDTRSSVQDIIAAYLIQHEKEQEALAQKLPMLVPGVAPVSSVYSASKKTSRHGGGRMVAVMPASRRKQAMVSSKLKRSRRRRKTNKMETRHARQV